MDAPGRNIVVWAGQEPTGLTDMLKNSGYDILRIDIGCEDPIAICRDATVGIALIGPDDGEHVAGLDMLTSLTRMEWVAVLPPEAILVPEIGRLVLENFYDYHTLPVAAEQLMLSLDKAYTRAQLRLSATPARTPPGKFGMIGDSPAMQHLFCQLAKVAAADAPVLITGETGTGKEVAARAIHRHSMRAGAPFIALNCASLPATLVQSELFGYEKGAFTGANQRKQGCIEAAAGGVLFLDEIGDLPLELQATLLRFLQEKTIVRLGSTQALEMDVRVLAATHVDLEEAVARGRFREDLYYRLNVLHLNVPPLRHRTEDIAPLVESFAADVRKHHCVKAQGFSKAAMFALKAHTWPGNVRELLNRVQHAMIMSEDRLVSPRDLELSDISPNCPRSVTLNAARERTERDVIGETLHHAKYNVTRAARELGVSRVTLYRLMNKFSIGMKYPMAD